MHKEAAALADSGSSSLASAEALATDLLRLGPGPDGHAHLHYLRYLLTRTLGMPMSWLLRTVLK